MSSLGIKPVIVLELEGQEMTLVSKALTGRLVKPGERKQAWLLAKRLAEMRAQHAKTIHEVAAGVLPHFAEMPDELSRLNNGDEDDE